MNERIKLPAQEWLGYDPERGDIHGYTFDQMRQFSELIVRECAGLFPNVYVEIKTDYGHTPVIAADYIKQHFGVEE